MAGCEHVQNALDASEQALNTSQNIRENLEGVTNGSGSSFPQGSAQTISLEQIWNDYKQSSAAASSKWEGKTVILSGKVQGVEKKKRMPTVNENSPSVTYYSVTIQDLKNTECSALVSMNENSSTTRKVLALRTGDTVSISAKLSETSRFLSGSISSSVYSFENGLLK
ncbi:OB-fold putative lipoprotein [Entomomonas sp. E2T0]|uniref:OB-fold putative lipoprotein n=1 Tax=Entomomonas sp. E2T0 TaxID=2930213 RepID=UPI00222838BF|nr:OB-fold putative lipoprotein [Entomomonas sp. E2T0]UYZ84657.1 OB-fold putative lipoprotein [Entomomonas sp. E2T0]